MIINHNLSAINAHRTLKFTDWSLNKSIEKLSSGMRINRGGDDASGLAVSEKMRSQIRGLRQAERNTEDGISFIQTTEGYLSETTDILHRLRELAIQAANGIYSVEDRTLIQVEVSQLVDEVDRVASQAQFNKLNMLTGRFANPAVGGIPTSSIWFHIGANMDQRVQSYVGTMTALALGLKNGTGELQTVSTIAMSNRLIGVVDQALDKVAKQRADLGAYQNRLEFTARGLMIGYENLQASESRIRDTDMAEEMVAFTRSRILLETGTSMLAQANMVPQTVLKLLG